MPLAQHIMTERLRFRFRDRVHTHFFPRFVVTLKLDHTVDFREKRVITPLANIRTRMNPGAALTNNDRAGMHLLAVITLHTQILRIAVPAVP